MKDPDYKTIKQRLEQFKEVIIKQTLQAVYDNGTNFFKNIFCKIDFGEAETS